MATTTSPRLSSVYENTSLGTYLGTSHGLVLPFYHCIDMGFAERPSLRCFGGYLRASECLCWGP